MKLAFIGGGSVQWTVGLMVDMALTDTLAGVVDGRLPLSFTIADGDDGPGWLAEDRLVHYDDAIGLLATIAKRTGVRNRLTLLRGNVVAPEGSSTADEMR